MKKTVLTFGLISGALTAAERGDAEQLAQERYATEAWTRDLP